MYPEIAMFMHCSWSNDRERISLFASDAVDFRNLIEWPTPEQWMNMANNRPYRLFTFTQWPRFRAKYLHKFPAQYE